MIPLIRYKSKKAWIEVICLEIIMLMPVAKGIIRKKIIQNFEKNGIPSYSFNMGIITERTVFVFPVS